MKITDLSKSELNKLISEHDCINQMLKSLGVNSNGSGAYKTFKLHCKNLGISIPPNKNRGTNNLGNKIPLSEILVKNSTYQNITRLKKRLVSEGIMEYKCSKCGNTGQWMGNLLVLQLDHKNGVHNDHRLENIRFLCPNCHSQTQTFSGRNTKT